MDRRIKKSKKALKRALFELIVKKEYSKITVSELCELADVNRSTFYSNYEDMDTLISDIHRDFFDEMIKKYTTENLEGLSDLQIHQKAISGMIEYVEQNRKLAKILFSHGDRRLLEKNMFTYFKERYYSKRPDILEVYPFTYHTMAFISLLNTWINDDFPCSADQFSKIIYEHSATLWNIP